MPFWLWFLPTSQPHQQSISFVTLNSLNNLPSSCWTSVEQRLAAAIHVEMLAGQGKSLRLGFSRCVALIWCIQVLHSRSSSYLIYFRIDFGAGCRLCSYDQWQGAALRPKPRPRPRPRRRRQWLCWRPSLRQDGTDLGLIFWFSSRGLIWNYMFFVFFLSPLPFPLLKAWTRAGYKTLFGGEFKFRGWSRARHLVVRGHALHIVAVWSRATYLVVRGHALYLVAVWSRATDLVVRGYALHIVAFFSLFELISQKNVLGCFVPYNAIQKPYSHPPCHFLHTMGGVDPRRSFHSVGKMGSGDAIL